MCGILNVISKSDKVLDLPACRRALSTLSWRGPDLCIATVWEDRVFIGQTVLSLTGEILDRKEEYATSQSGRFVVSFNGEIYNFKELNSRWLAGLPFRSPHTTDTEILANLHEVLGLADIPQHLDGMYAYTLLDKQQRTLSLCRDVQGEKSLYLYEDENLIVISSEIGAILTLARGAELDCQALRDYFRTRHLMHLERTVYGQIRQLLPGRLETLDLNTMKWSVIQRRQLSDWIDPGRIEKNMERSLDELAEELDALLTRCVREMLPEGRRYAAVVSGGVDSSLIARYLVRYGDPDVLVAVNHVGKDRISSDLSGFERVLGRDIHVLRIDEVPYSAEIVRCQRACGSPLLAHSFVPQSLQSAFVRSAGCRVLFGGEGGDELFGGYGCYLEQHQSDGRFSPSPYTAHSNPEVEFTSDNSTRLQEELAEAWSRSLEAYRCIHHPEARATLAMMYCDAFYQLPAVGLRGADLMSMMWSVEARSLFLRRPVVEFALNLPLSAKVDLRLGINPLLREKVLLKRLFLRYYPRELLFEKQGFAGFPNESAAYLGEPDDYLVYDVLGIRRQRPAYQSLSRAASWKLTNIEYFLRSRSA